MGKLRRFANLLLGIAITLVTIGGAVLLFQEQLKKQLPSVQERYYDWLPALGLGLCALGLLLCFVIVISFGFTVLTVPFRVARTFFQNWLESDRYECRIAKRRDVEWIHSFGQEQLRVTADLNMLREWQAINYEIFWVIIEKKVRRERARNLVGYFALIPLNKVATDLVEAEKVDGGSFTREHIIPHRRGRIRKRPSSIYIGGVAAKTGLRLRQFTLDSLRTLIGSENSNHYVKTFYTRPVTTDGLRLVRRHRFLPVNKFVKGFVKDHIYKYQFDDDDRD